MLDEGLLDRVQPVGARAPVGEAREALDALKPDLWRRGLFRYLTLPNAQRRMYERAHEQVARFPGVPEPLRPSRHDAGLQLLQRIRDECHRFALSRHRAQRSKRSLRSVLDDVAGIGPVRKRALLRRFGSVAAVATADPAELERVVGAAAAAKLKSALTALAESPEGPRVA